MRECTDRVHPGRVDLDIESSDGSGAENIPRDEDLEGRSLSSNGWSDGNLGDVDLSIGHETAHPPDLADIDGIWILTEDYQEQTARSTHISSIRANISIPT